MLLNGDQSGVSTHSMKSTTNVRPNTTTGEVRRFGGAVGFLPVSKAGSNAFSEDIQAH